MLTLLFGILIVLALVPIIVGSAAVLLPGIVLVTAIRYTHVPWVSEGLVGLAIAVAIAVGGVGLIWAIRVSLTYFRGANPPAASYGSPSASEGDSPDMPPA